MSSSQWSRLMLESRHLDLPQIMGGVEVGTLGSTYYDTYFFFCFFTISRHDKLHKFFKFWVFFQLNFGLIKKCQRKIPRVNSLPSPPSTSPPPANSPNNFLGRKKKMYKLSLNLIFRSIKETHN